MPGFTVSAVKGVGVAFSWRPAGGRGFLLARRTSHEVALYWEDLRRASLCRSCEGRSRAGVYRMENGLQACSLHDSPECVSVGCHMQVQWSIHRAVLRTLQEIHLILYGQLQLFAFPKLCLLGLWALIHVVYNSMVTAYLRCAYSCLIGSSTGTVALPCPMASLIWM
ncbi:uncharacterized protein LOC116968711 isoform X3 [Amblyraja radiata]|uniref:uncharacterized protein LOC116968711 isoform X3 n=1 Tax=Amblyraja radiata TaxID=386614 RepID=UPI001403F86D|nr:uncharacterized protein LOC116968711 isoform X3 [Amblyraja radiata]